MLKENDYPITVKFDAKNGIFSPVQKTVERRLSDLKNMFHDRQSVEQILTAGDRLVYEIRYYPFITSKSDMALGVTRIFPGKVGDEYHMTKGHIHERDDQPEIYHCVQGHGYLLMDTLQGDFEAVAWEPGTITHIPPMWAHRVVNTGDELLVFVASYHISAGHNYDLVEQKGFARIVVEREGKAVLLPNDRR
jgi:glucose-6-phosphate isomerase